MSKVEHPFLVVIGVHVLPKAAWLDVDSLRFPVVLPKQRLLAKLQCELLAKGFSLGEDEEVHKFLRRKRENQRESWPTVYCFSLFPYFLFIKIQSHSITRQKKDSFTKLNFTLLHF